MSTSQSETIETREIIATITNFEMEVGVDHHGFCVWISQKEERE